MADAVVVRIETLPGVIREALRVALREHGGDLLDFRPAGAASSERALRAMANDVAKSLTLSAVGNESALVDRVLRYVCEVHDGGDLWGHARRDPDAFRNAVRAALAESSQRVDLTKADAELILGKGGAL